MNKEETLSNLKAYLDGDTAIGNIIPLRSVLESAIKYLEPSLPSNLDEVAEEYGRKEYSHAIHFWDEGLSKNKPEVMKEDFVDAFKAGAKWMAEQGVSVDGLAGYCMGDVLCPDFELEEMSAKLKHAGFKPGDEVVVQIRKK